MLFVRPRSSYQALFMGVLLLGLFLLWIRAAVILYALFFGLKPFPGTDEVVPMLLFTPTGWALLFVGSAVGALFAAFAFAISVFAVPMLLEERTDALTAMGISMAMVWNNLAVMIAWGAIVLVLFVLSVADRLHRADPGLPGARARHLARLPGAARRQRRTHVRPAGLTASPASPQRREGRRPEQLAEQRRPVGRRDVAGLGGVEQREMACGPSPGDHLPEARRLGGAGSGRRVVR